MSQSRRDVLKGRGAMGAALVLRVDADAEGQDLVVAGQPVELRVASISPRTVRISIVPRGPAPAALNPDGGLVALNEQRRTVSRTGPIRAGDATVSVSDAPLTVRIADASGRQVQELSVDASGVLHFLRLNRIRMYWEGSQFWKPNERPYALHRNGYAGMARYPAFLWSGITMRWADRDRRLTLSLTPGSKMRAPLIRDIEVRVAGSQEVRQAKFSGKPVSIEAP